MCGSRNYPYPPHGWFLEILRGWGGGLKHHNFVKERMLLNWKFQRG